ncbi:hypothetical protein [Nonomuraea sp. B5E05]|uniref:hypothetical protein n=1 Tax=Nonomuraea sp. B5E05 TaxID=3153569 RepID=UPI003260D71F
MITKRRRKSATIIHHLGGEHDHVHPRGRTALAGVGQDQHDDASALLGAAAHHGGERSPHRDGETPLRDLLGDQVLERSLDGAGGLR